MNAFVHLDSERNTVRSYLDFWAAECPESPFLISSKTKFEFTFRDVAERCKKVSGFLENSGVHAGSTIAFALTNNTQSAACVLGIIHGGYLATAVNLVAGAQTIQYVLDHSECRVVVVDDVSRAQIEEICQKLDARPQIVHVDEFDQGSTNQNALPAKIDIAPSDPALLMYTSGTTGRPKGVVLSHSNLVAGGLNTANAHELSTSDRALCVLPLYHINGFCVTLMAPLVSGGSVVIPDRFSVSSFWNNIGENRCSWFSVVPTQISYLLHDADVKPRDAGEFPFLRFGRSASAPLSPDLHEAFQRRFSIPVVETMGLTETAAQILSNPLDPNRQKIGSPGIAYGNEVIIADGNDKSVPIGVEGEVYVRGANVMRGYLKNPEATQDALTHDGWLRTGDLGKIDEDGFVFITGRKKELIIKGGENIAPREIDEALYTHPDVVEAAAFARSCADYGQRVEAGVMLADGSNVSEAELVALCTRIVGAFKSPDRIHILPELPKGPSGKIQRIRLADLVASV